LVRGVRHISLSGEEEVVGRGALILGPGVAGDLAEVVRHPHHIGPDALVVVGLHPEPTGLPGDGVVGLDPDPIAVADAPAPGRLRVDHQELAGSQLRQQRDLARARLLVLDHLETDEGEVVLRRRERPSG